MSMYDRLLRLPMGILFATILMLSLPQSATAQDQGATKGNMWEWKLSDARIIELGAETAIAEGTLIHDYTVEARAVATNPSAPIRSGVFRWEGTVFSPSADMPGRKVGRWYVRGKWTITALDVSPEVLKIKHNSALVEGELEAVLPFNPTRSREKMAAKVELFNSLAAGRWSSGSGKLAGNGRFEGTMRIQLEQRPDVSGSGTR